MNNPPPNAAYATTSNFDSASIPSEDKTIMSTENIYFPCMNAQEESEFANICPAPSSNYDDVNDGLRSNDLLSQPFGNYDTDWDSFLNEFTTDTGIEAPSSFNTSLQSASPALSTSLHHTPTPDTQVSGGCTSINVPLEGFSNTGAAPEAVMETSTPGGDPQQQMGNAPDTTADDSQQRFASAEPYLATAVDQAALIAAGAKVYTAASLGLPPSEPVLAMNTSPRHRVFRMPVDIGPGGKTRYLEPHEIAQYANPDIVKPNIILPPELERYMYYPPGQGPSQQRQQPQQMPQRPQQFSQAMPEQLSQQMQEQIQGQNPQMNKPLLRQQTQNIASLQQPYTQRYLQQTQRVQQLQQPRYQVGAQSPTNQHLQGHNVPMLQSPQRPPHFQSQQNTANSQQLAHQHFLPQDLPLQNVNSLQSGREVPRSVPQQVRQFRQPSGGQMNPQTYTAMQNKNLELCYTANGYQPPSNRAERPHDINSNEWIRNRDFRPMWNVGDIYTDWLDPGSKTIEPHMKTVMKKDIKLGLSSQDAAKAAITDGFVRGAAWAAKMFLTQMEREMKEQGTMMGFRPHKKVKKPEMERSMVDHIVKTTTPSIHGAQAANVIAWAYDEFYPGVFCQEGSNGKPRSPHEIFQAWKNIQTTVSREQLSPVLFDTSTGLTVMTDMKPTRPPVATVKSFVAPIGQQPAIRIAQFPVIGSKNVQALPTGGQSFFTSPEVPATMAMQQMKRVDSTATASKPKPQGTKTAPKTAEQKKETRNRKADEKIGWTLTGQARLIEVDGIKCTSYQCSDRECRILDGQRLEDAKERTLKLQRKQRGAKAMADAAGISVQTPVAKEVPCMAAQTGAEIQSSGQVSASIGHIPLLPAPSPTANISGVQGESNSETRKRRAPDEASLPGTRKRVPKVTQERSPGLYLNKDMSH
ncbi:hypothetical protein NLG97_g5665 [Lecanicillium saksenae]|uniref:Uncharacterized protein n=1 Tax=Lecanicillium saksenae TaxID=468837 RepID=A0ACC1QSZ4_9HYPO|nr:hypothetical protein NLG97_g5665 [Lecanicillium saksenae]